MRKKAFTLSEVMVVLVVLGVLAAVLIPNVKKASPNKNKLLFKKAYMVTEGILDEMVNTSKYYTYSDPDTPGLVDQSPIALPEQYAFGPTKFCEIFADKVNTVGNINCDSSHSNPASGSTNLSSGNFTTTDGITWHLPTTPASGSLTVFTIPPAANGNTRDIIIDVNGTDEFSKSSPNCVYNATTCPIPDQFTISVQHDGKIIIDGQKEIEYLKSITAQ